MSSRGPGVLAAWLEGLYVGEFARSEHGNVSSRHAPMHIGCVRPLLEDFALDIDGARAVLTDFRPPDLGLAMVG
jgi:hypothetical protein